MKLTRLSSLFSVTVIIVLLFSLFHTVNVRADEETPPPLTDEQTASETEPTSELTNEPDSGETPEPTAESTPEADSSESSESNDEAQTPAEVLESAPEGVDVVVLDENGEPLALATEEAVQIFMEGDPMWCPDGATPGNDPGGDCTLAYADFATLLAELTTNTTDTYSGNGTIYVAHDYAASENLISFNHNSGDLVNLGNLTIQGGWDFGTDGMHNGDATYQSTLNGTALSIYNWVGDVTINNLFIDQGTYTALSIFTEGDVELNYVSTDNADDWGLLVGANGNVELNNVHIEDSAWTGAEIGSGGNVEINNSSFNNNGWDANVDMPDPDSIVISHGNGLVVSAVGDITLNNVAANDNANHGANLFTGGNVLVTDSSEFDWNGYGGSYSSSYGMVANGNITNWFANVDTEAGSGLVVEAGGNITLQQVAAENNAGFGGDLTSNGGYILIEDSVFNENGWLGFFELEYGFVFDSDTGEYFGEFDLESNASDGLWAQTIDGNITLNNVVANFNANYGADLYSSAGNIFITDYSQFNGNGYGIGAFDEYESELFDELGYETIDWWLVANDDDTAFCEVLAGIGAGYTALVFDPCNDSGYIDVVGPNFDYFVYAEGNTGTGTYANVYEIEQDGGNGLEAYTQDGSITASNVEASGNSEDGAHFHSYGNGGVSITGGIFEENGWIGDMYVYECLEYGSGLCSGTIADGIAAGMHFDYGNGLYVDAYGPVTLNELYVAYNGDDGAIVYSDDSSILIENSIFEWNGYPVYIGGEGGLFGYFLCDELSFCSEIPLPVSEFDFGFGFFEDSDSFFVGGGADFSSGTGLDADAEFNVTLNNVYTYDNLGYGAYLYADEGNIFITQSAFDDNGYGLNGGGFFEAYADVNVEYLIGDFDLYNGNGLYADAEGDITLSSVSASGNSLYGAELYSDATNSVFIQYSDFNDNGNYGALGPGIWIGGFIFLVDNVPVEEDFYEYYGSGLYIQSAGNVTLQYVNANSNFQDGAEVYSNSGQVNVVCGTYNDNGYGNGDGYGVYEEGASSLGLYGPEILGNYYSPDEYYFSNSLVLSDDCVIPGTGQKTTGTSSVCLDDQNHLFLVKNDANEFTGDFVMFPCPIRDTAFVTFVGEENLPAPLPDFKPDEEGGEAIYRSALRTELTREGKSIDVNDGLILVSFLIPDGVDIEILAILFWNGNEWVDLGGVVSDVGPDGKVVEGKQYFQIYTLNLGNFALVTK